MEPMKIDVEPQVKDAAALRRKKAQKRLLALAALIVIGGGTYWYFGGKFNLSFNNVLSLSNTAEKFAIDQVQKNFSAPPPLRATKTPPSSPSAPSGFTLTRSGIIAQTNIQRAANGALPALSQDATLNEIATARLNDMFAKQYFAHVAPDGGSAETVAKTMGYDYLAIGENLALGNFAGDRGVVEAWMESPGHRANILSTHYTEIGVAARSGVFEGEKTWIAVQIFGRPASDCPPPDGSLKAALESEQTQLEQMAADLQAKKSAIDAMDPKGGSAYNQKANEYNAEVEQYNQIVAQTKIQTAQYNAEVVTFNACIGV